MWPKPLLQCLYLAPRPELCQGVWEEHSKHSDPEVKTGDSRAPDLGLPSQLCIPACGQFPKPSPNCRAGDMPSPGTCAFGINR